jgi:hypothetical protein
MVLCVLSLAVGAESLPSGLIQQEKLDCYTEALIHASYFSWVGSDALTAAAYIDGYVSCQFGM